MQIGYIRTPTWYELRRPRLLLFWGCGLFRNRPDVRPGRWGFYLFGWEFGCRNPGDPVGVTLKRLGLWPW